MEQEPEERQETRSVLTAWERLAGLLILGSIVAAFWLANIDSPTATTGAMSSNPMGADYSDAALGSPSAPTEQSLLADNSGSSAEPTPETRTIHTETTVQLDGLDRKQFLASGFETPADISAWLPDICNDMETGGNGMLELDTPADTPAASKENLQDMLKALSIKYLCPELAASMGEGSLTQYIALTTDEAPDPKEKQYGGLTREEWIELQKYAPRNGTTGGGYATTCADGTTSHAGGKQGACSWHGGTR